MKTNLPPNAQVVVTVTLSPHGTGMLSDLPPGWHTTIFGALCLGEGGCVSVGGGGGAVSPLPASIQARSTVQQWSHSLRDPPTPPPPSHSLCPPSRDLTHQRLRFLELSTDNNSWSRPWAQTDADCRETIAGAGSTGESDFAWSSVWVRALRYKIW